MLLNRCQLTIDSVDHRLFDHLTFDHSAGFPISLPAPMNNFRTINKLLERPQCFPIGKLRLFGLWRVLKRIDRVPAQRQSPAGEIRELYTNTLSSVGLGSKFDFTNSICSNPQGVRRANRTFISHLKLNLE